MLQYHNLYQDPACNRLENVSAQMMLH